MASSIMPAHIWMIESINQAVFHTTSMQRTAGTLFIPACWMLKQRWDLEWKMHAPQGERTLRNTVVILLHTQRQGNGSLRALWS